MDIENDLKALEQLEDKEFKKKEKRDHKIEEDEVCYRVKFDYNNCSKICKSKNKDIKNGDFLIVPTPYGNEVGYVLGVVTDKDEIQSQEEIFNIVRIATEEDLKKYRTNKEKSKKAFDITLQKIKEHGLDMKLINAHYFLEEPKLLFNFTSDGRVDFRELVKDLASIFKTRIELRQIGVRDECRIMSGYGHCGRHFCCANVLSDIEPVTIKMAKEQNLTLNSLKISGICGRLLCCLGYEYKTYCEEKSRFPGIGEKVKINNEQYNVSEVNIQTENIKLVSQNEDRVMYINLKEIKYDQFWKIWVLK